MISPQRTLLAIAALAAFGCATKPERVILLPDASGKSAALAIQRIGEKTETRLDRPYAEAMIGKSDISVGTTDAKRVGERYGTVLAATPRAPRSLVVYFETGGNELTASSIQLLDSLLKDISSDGSVDVVVTGHTDRVGNVEANDALSLKRAEAVRDRLVAAGVGRARIATAGRGEREPLVPTADEVAEPRNRRVEVKVR